jgi:Zn-dependent protease
MGPGFGIGRVWGIPIGLHPSWFLIFALLSANLAIGLLPAEHPGWTPATYWLVGTVSAVVLFVCLLIHELAHSWVALRHGLPIRGITLFVFGGVSRLGAEAPSPAVEIRMALAGPLVSVVLGGLFAAAAALAHEAALVAAPCRLIARVNVTLALFNLLPGYPLDGGRVLRALLWRRTGSFRRATRVAAHGGQAAALGLAALGAGLVLSGRTDGLWLMLIGWFLHTAASTSASESTLAEALAGVTVRQAMRADAARVLPTLPLDRLVHDRVLGGGERCFLVVENGHLDGLVTLPDLRAMPRARWGEATVGDVMRRMGDLVTASPEEDLATALRRMDDAHVAQLPVVANGAPLGLLTREQVLRWVRARLELGHVPPDRPVVDRRGSAP